MIRLGEFVTLKVVRKSDLGYMLTDGEVEVLLHFKQSLSEHNNGDEVTVFIYSDNERRITATEKKPILSMGEMAFVKVVNKIAGAGIFVNIDTPKDIFISKDNLPYDESLWPIEGDTLFITLKVKQDTLTAKPVDRYDIISLHKNINYADGENVVGYVVRVGDKGVSIITKDMMYVFVPHHQLRGVYRLGEEVCVTITKKINEEYYGTLNPHKEMLIDSDKEIIMDYLKKHNGSMKITAKTSAEIIEREFKISRKAFKRAYGGLYKDKIIDFDEDKTFIVKEN